MALWGNSTSDESRPKWLRQNDNPANDLNRCFADERGWVLRHENGFEEVLVTISGLGGAGAADKLGNATIVGVYFKDKSYAQGATGTVIVNYNEKVTVTNGATIGIAGTSTGSITATASTQTCVQQVEFTFTVPSTTQVLSIPAGSITGTVKDCNTATNSDKAFTLGDIKGSGGAGVIKTISVA